MILIQRIHPNNSSPRSMPPPPERSFGKINPQIFSELSQWLNNNLN
jgi:hypothetical protein